MKALGSVKHEGPTTRKRQKGEICQALNTEAFTSFCQAYDGAMCSELRGQHFLLPPYGVQDCTASSSSSRALGCIRDLLLDLSRLLGLALRPSRSCLSLPPGILCHAGGWHLRRKPRVDLFYVSFFIVVLFRFFIFVNWCCTALNRRRCTSTRNFRSREAEKNTFCTHCVICDPFICHFNL